MQAANRVVASTIVVAICLSILSVVPAQSQVINLASPDGCPNHTLFHLTQWDPRWANRPTGNPQLTIREAGCGVTTLAMILNSMQCVPLEPTYNYVDDVPPMPPFDFTKIPPSYVADVITRANGWDKNLPKAASLKNACTTGGIQIDYGRYADDFDSFIQQSLKRGVPVWAGIHTWDKDSQGHKIPPVKNHAVLVTGYDPDRGYMIMDPDEAPGLCARGKEWTVERRDWVYADELYSDPDFTGRIFRIGIPKYVTSIWDSIIDFVIHSPVAPMLVAPDGRRTGYDPATGLDYQEIPQSFYVVDSGGWDLQPFTDPVGELAVLSAEPGAYKLYLVGTGTGPYTIEFQTGNGQTQTIQGNASPGEIIRYTIVVDSQGAISAQPAASFPPSVQLADRVGLVGTPTQFDASRSVGHDAPIASFEWDFGDGSTGAGATASHTFTSPGIYSVKVTVRDGLGQSSTAAIATTIYGPGSGAGGSVAVGGIEQASLDSTGGETYRGDSWAPSISADGRYVAFQSYMDLVPSHYGHHGVFVRDTVSKTTTQAFDAGWAGGELYPRISPDGRFVAYGNGIIKLYDRQTGKTEQIDLTPSGTSSDGSNGDSAQVSADNRYVSFESDATNILSGTNNHGGSGSGAWNVYLRDRNSSTTELVDVSSAGVPAEKVPCGSYEVHCYRSMPKMTSDARFVLFTHQARNLVQTYPACNYAPYPYAVQFLYLRDRQAGTTELLMGTPMCQGPEGFAISDDGRYIAVITSDYKLAGYSSPPDGYQPRFLVLYDRAANQYDTVAQGPFNSGLSISAGGRFVAFRKVVQRTSGLAYDLPFLYDHLSKKTYDLTTDVRTTGVTDSRCCVGTTGIAMSRDASSVAFTTSDPNLVPNDDNDANDIFVEHLTISSPIPVANAQGSYAGWSTSSAPAAYITFDSSQSYDPNGQPLTATWDFGDGSPTVTSPVASNVTHSYQNAGSYTVTLVVSNGMADSAPVTTTADIKDFAAQSTSVTPRCGNPRDNLEIVINHIPTVPVAGGWNLGGMGSGAGPLPSVTTLAAATVAALSFDGPGGDLSGAQVPVSAYTAHGYEYSASFKWATRNNWTPGNYTVSANGLGSASFVVPCPVPDAYLHRPVADAGGPYQAGAGTAVPLDGSKSMDPQGLALSYYWDFGDSEGATGVAPTHVYATPGKYQVSLSVANSQYVSTCSIRNHCLTSATITIVKTLSVTPDSVTREYGASNPTLTGTVTGLDPADGITVSYTTSATLTSPVGSYPIAAVVNDPNNRLSTYNVTLNTGTLTITPASSTTVVASSGQAHFGQQVTFTVTVSSPSGTPTGSADFLDGTAVLGTVTLSGGTATYKTTSLAEGSHSISARYSGNSNVSGSASSPVAQTITPASLSITAVTTTLSVKAGQQGTAQVTVDSQGTLTSPVSLACSGLQAGSECTFNPSVVAASTLPSTVTVTVKTTGFAIVGRTIRPNIVWFFAAMIPGAILMSAPFGKKNRCRLLMLMAILFVVLLNGCGGSAPPSVTNAPLSSNGVYTLTVTATSGSANASTTIQLTVTK